jgi:hypothetical protein
MKRQTLCCVIALLLALTTQGFASGSQRPRARKPQPAKVCGDPTARCPTSATFEANDLSFRIPKNAVMWETEDFYAVVLKSVRTKPDDCAQFVSETERLAAQSLFPQRKVFTSRCVDAGSLYYTNTAPNQRLMGVYAGATRAEAARTLAAVKATGRFPGANIRRMRAGFNGT